MNGNRKEIRMMHHLAKASGYRNINLWFKADPTNFISVAKSWRELQEGII